jgi:hypothetical protein
MAIDISKNYTVFDSVNMASTKYAERIFDCVCDENVENGTFGYMAELVDRNIYQFVRVLKLVKKFWLLTCLFGMKTHLVL